MVKHLQVNCNHSQKLVDHVVLWIDYNILLTLSRIHETDKTTASSGSNQSPVENITSQLSYSSLVVLKFFSQNRFVRVNANTEIEQIYNLINTELDQVLHKYHDPEIENETEDNHVL